LSSRESEIGDCMGYPCIELETSIAIKMLEKIASLLGYVTDDIMDSIRIIEDFDESYRYSVKKFKEYIVPVKREADLIRGRVVVDRIKLRKVGENRRVLVVFERRVDRDLIKRALESIKRS